ncbi:PREDICTED: RNA-dependent RNA polymerase 1-like [Branchiostoma belcheri]|uniref:RNA-dependent RNA polymerase n=1 Tax=Branchiostoma belcheri TaxID=7741 RepID=A0A6P5A154_BRABE|nr:PREDICTED: RNA-dependent RNA polymerase 1-like [Branchiostoma belcheri]
MSAPSFTLPVTVTLERPLDSQVKRGVDNFMKRWSRVVSSTTLSSHQTWNQDAVPSTEFELQPRDDDEFDTAEEFFCFLRLKWCKVPIFGLGWLTPDEEAHAFSKSERNTPAHSDIELETFALGAFKERSTFVNHYDASAYGSQSEDDSIRTKLERQVTFEHDRRQLAVHFKPSEDEGVHKFEVDYDNLESYILVNDSHVQTKLYFFLKHPLKVFRAVNARGCLVDEIESVNTQTVWKRTTSFGGCTTNNLGYSSCLQLVIDNDGAVTSTPHAVLSRLCQSCGFTANFVSVRHDEPSLVPLIPPKKSPAHFDCVYALRVFLSRGYTVMDQIDRHFFQKLRDEEDKKFGPDFVCEILRRLTLTVENNRFADIDSALRQLRAMKDTIMGTEQTQFPAAHRKVRRVFVTPTRLMFMHPEIVRDNRILRKYGEDNFMRVSIRDEDFGKLQAFGRLVPGEDETFTHVKRVLQEGLRVWDRNYEFLAASNSQLREHNVWFFASDGENTADSIRREMGDFSGIKCPALVLARMGQCFSNTEPSVIAKTSTREVVKIPDIKSKECCFSDGIGKISQSLAQKGDVMQVRPSMMKFKSSDQNIEICMTSRPAPLYLNRQVITILSALGVPDLNFQKLQETTLQNLSDMLVREDVAFKSLKKTAQSLGLPLGRLSRCGLHVTTEPFFRAMLQKMFTCSLGELRRRARIEIPPEYGRNMLGVLDETGTLKYGEVFVQYREDITDKSSRTRVLTDNVVVTRNPCFHPGDVRKLTAVDVPGLYHMVDVIVFPSKGPRPHPNEMSGGDLDGDEYFVTWYPDLIFPGPNETPMDFTAQERKWLPRVETQDIKDFIVEYIKNDILGQIANAHLASAHTLAGGIFSSRCLGLAKKHSDAVDFPKTGVCPSLEKDERPFEYPDFMGKKKGKTTRRSESVQGKMFRECQRIERVCSHLHEDKDIGSQTIKLDKVFFHQNWKRYAVSSREARDQYNEKLQDLMKQYGIATEAEAVSGCIVSMRPHMEDRYERFEAERIAKDRIAHLRKQTRQEFFHDFGGEESVDLDRCPEKVMAKASAWYYASYRVGNPGLLSFPWVVADVLAELKKRTTSSLIRQPVLDRITEDLDEVYGTQFYTTFMNLMDPKDDGHSRGDHVLMYMRRYATVIHLVSFLLQWRKEHCSQLNRTDLLFLFTTYAVNQGFFEDLGMTTQNETVELQIFLRRTKEDDFYNSLSILGGKATGELCISFLKYLSSYEFMETPSVSIRGRLLSLPASARENLHAKALVAYHLLAQTGDIRRLTSTTDTTKEILWEWGMEIPPNLWDQHFYGRKEMRERELLGDTGVQEVHVRPLRRVRGPYRGHLSAVGTEESINELQLVMDNLIDRFKNTKKNKKNKKKNVTLRKT